MSADGAACAAVRRHRRQHVQVTLKSRACSLVVRWLFVGCSLVVRWLFVGCSLVVRWLFRTRAFNIECISTAMEPNCADVVPSHPGVQLPATPTALGPRQPTTVGHRGLQEVGTHVRVDGVRKMPRNAAKTHLDVLNELDELI